MSFIAVKDQLKTIVETLEGTYLEEVYAYPESNPGKWPCAQIFMSRSPAEVRLESNSNLMGVGFFIRVLLRPDNDETQENLRLTILDALMDAFRTSANVDTLNGTCERFDLLDPEPISTDQAEQPLFGFALPVIAYKIKEIT